MGISGLLPALKSITDTKPLDSYRGQTLAIDAYVWLHRAIYSCSQEICLGQETDKYVSYFMERVDMLLHNGITPYVVFDGGPLPMKKGTETERRAARQKNRELGIQLFKQGNHAEARKHFTRAADVSPFMAHRVIQRLKAKGVRYVVAPYEADAQLAYLTKNGLADGVITEDSDCLPFGCGTVLFKLDKDGVGLAQEIKECNLKKNTGLQFHMFTHTMFLEMCIFSGCDYLPSLPGFGLKKAYVALKQHGSFAKVIRSLRLEGKVRIPPTYEADFERAVLTFRHQRVFDPRSQQLVPLTPIPESVTEKDPTVGFLGPMLSNAVAVAIAQGDMDPVTMEMFPVVPASVTARESAPKGFARATSSAMSRPSPFQSWVVSPPTLARPEARTLPHSFAAAPHSHQQQSQHSQSGRRFPSSFARKPQPKPTPPSIMDVMLAPASLTPSRAAESSPPVVSRFFASQPKQASPLAESDKCLDATVPSSSSSMFESQDPVEVDVSRSISFSPVEEKTPSRAACENKENSAPSHAAPTVAPVVAVRETLLAAPRENAFSRMMRAGSMLQKHSLKRKAAASSSFRHVKKLQGLGSHHSHQHHGRTTEQHFQQHAHASPVKPQTPVKSLPAKQIGGEKTPAPVPQPSIASLDRFRFTK
ncbi:hypothetical protein PybrP1_009131 [[Pythium] brassicae (nom. inval.)]|nr:hypothetical protein PybrP1_009131 [[Pythium] brassicae (nom. inval.)]